MGSLEEERLLQMVHDFIESSESSTTTATNTISSSSAQNHVHFSHSTKYFTLQGILRKKTEEERRIIEKVGKHMRNKMDLEKTSSLKQWLVKCLNFDGFNASLCHTSWVTTPGCPCGTYEYIEVCNKEDQTKGKSHRDRRVIVDIDFKSQFEVARPTKSYTELTSKLPTIFVGSEDKLNNIISLLCSAAEESLRERGLHIPPWRRATYMLSKWKLSNCTTNNNNNNYHYYMGGTKSNNNICPNSNGNDGTNNVVTSRFGNKWVPPPVMMEGRRRRRDMSGGSGLSNQFSNMSINCC